ncbi:MAG TPA: phosphoadenosine phosphosulfate reductase family protein [Dehalococcoidales bacterium]|nr:phosphoadenosine phosphosulfate reductase family protein [Dehalococcoidales bacterium]
MTNSDKEKRCIEAVDKSKEVIRDAFKQYKVEDMAITWTGGKDSGLALWIIRQVCQEDNIKLPKVMTIDEFDVFQEIHDFMEKYAKEWNLDLEWCRNDDVIKAAGGELMATVKVADLNERNQAELKRINFEEDAFTFEAESYTGNHLMKTVMFNMYIERHNVKAIFQGLRRDEQAARTEDDYFEKKEAAHLIPEHMRIKPILHFTERLLWDTYQVFKIPYCTLYEQGYRSLGAKTTSAIAEPGVPAWEQDLENTTERTGRRQDKEQMMSRLRDLGYM